ncbi:MAG: pentapeptide repeat-containing protein [Rickettsiales bacterium]
MGMQLQAIVEQHLLWLESDGVEGKRANFRGLDLSGEEFPAVQLSQASFRNAILDGARFNGTLLEDADFSETRCHDTVFESCIMLRALFSRADLVGTRFHACHLEKANFLQAKAPTIRFHDCHMIAANFREAVLNGADIARSQLQEVALRAVAMHQARVKDSTLENADCREADFNGSTFHSVVWQKANCKNAKFEGVLLENSDLTAAEDLAPSALGHTEKTVKSQLDEQKKELQREAVRLGALRAELREERKNLDAVWQNLNTEKAQWGNTGADITKYASRLRAVSACWFMVTAGLATLVAYQVSRLGWGSLNMVEVGLVLGLSALVLGLHIKAAITSYQASERLRALLHSDDNAEVE